MTGAAKKSLFGILRPMLPEATVLDLYCGTGTLGLEALSNHAAYCCFADRDTRVVERLMRNIETCRAGSDAHVWTGNVEHHLPDWLDELRNMGRMADLAFLDPPYASARRWKWDKLIAKVFTPLREGLRDDAIVVLRLPDNVDIRETLGPLTLQRTKAYGTDMKVGFYQPMRSGT
jgi:16S rRNA (guanine(966)-N(2))-methyltransferase RsmD